MSIAGIKLQLSSAELVTLVQKRADYHRAKAEFLLQKATEIAPGLQEFDEEAEEMGKFSNARNGDPLETMRTKAKHHKDRVTYFKFLEEHVIPNETYILDENDLRRIEVLSGNGY